MFCSIQLRAEDYKFDVDLFMSFMSLLWSGVCRVAYEVIFHMLIAFMYYSHMPESPKSSSQNKHQDS